MKKIIILSGLIIILSAGANGQATPPKADSLARKIANKMKDSLGLTGNQRNQIYAINVSIHNQKSAIRQQYTNPDSLRRYIQRVENKRDSIYRTVLPENKYQLYKLKKRFLVSAN